LVLRCRAMQCSGNVGGVSKRPSLLRPAQAVQDFVESLDRKHFRPLQKDAYQCCAAACDSSRNQGDLQAR